MPESIGTFTVTGITETRTLPAYPSLSTIAHALGTLIYDWQEHLYDGANWNHGPLSSLSRRYNALSCSRLGAANILRIILYDNQGLSLATRYFTATGYTEDLIFNPPTASLNEVLNVLGTFLKKASTKTTNPYYMALGTTVYEQCLTQIRDDIRSLDLDDIDDSEVDMQWHSWDEYRFDRIITVHPAHTHFTYGGGTANKDDIGYNCQVTIVYPKEGDERTGLTRISDWVAAIRSKFINQRLGTLASVHTCHVLTGDVSVPKAFDRDKNIYTAMIIRPWSREPRG